MATILQMPGTEPATPARGLNLSRDELVEASGGYVRPAEQLRALHERGFVRAFRRRGAGPVILERAHYDSVVRGQFGQQPAANDSQEPRKPLPPNRAGYRARHGKAGA